MSAPLYAGIDAGGTEFKCVLGEGPERVLVQDRIAVAEPEATLAACAAFFRRAMAEQGAASALGIASFGPLDLRPDSPGFGRIASTPKPLWSGTDLVGYFREQLGLPIRLDTDVNGALLAEQRWGAAAGLHSAVYVTVGTGIGAGAMIDGRLLHGAMHPEAGHMRLAKYENDPFSGVCPYHGACLEGLASGPALAQRWQQNPKALPEHHPAWALEAHYLAAMCVNLALLYSPQRIILGGGVMQRVHLFPLIRRAYLAQINGYLGDQSDTVADFIVPAALGDMAGALGAIALAQSL
jgi:fructokinase